MRQLDGVQILPADLTPHLALKTPPSPGGMKIQGAQLVLDGVRPDQIHLLLDCSAVRRAGQYTLRLRPETLPNATVLDWTPRELSVDIVASGK